MTKVVTGLAAAVILAGCGEKDEPDLAGLPAQPTTPSTTTTTTATVPAGGARERAVATAVGDYVEALDAGDGTRVCSLLVPGALETVDLPFRRGGCGPSLTRSIGYRDPRGLPVFAGAEVVDVSVRVRGETARAVMAVRITFADRAQAPVEDDVVYLERDRDRWLIAKPSATLYRAVGIANVPPSVLAPPR